MTAICSNLVFAALLLMISGAQPASSQVCQIDQIAHRWQSRLHLEEWNIRISFATGEQIGAEVLGDIEYDWKTRIARIRVLDPSERRGELGVEAALRECENTTLHELIHLMLSRATPPVDSDEEERVILALTEALLVCESRP